jgi:hypothetical protein
MILTSRFVYRTQIVSTFDCPGHARVKGEAGESAWTKCYLGRAWRMLTNLGQRTGSSL